MNLSSVSILLVYTFAAISFLLGVFLAPEWKASYLSAPFVATVIVVPFVMVAFASAVQILTFIHDAKIREAKYRDLSEFLAALESCHATSQTGARFLSHLLDEWRASMTRLRDGVITIQKDYWRVCAQLYDLAVRLVECTSLVPVHIWDEDDPQGGSRELLSYKREQIEKLIKRGIEVRRTFILEASELPDNESLRTFFRIVIKQLSEDFKIYYVCLDEHSDPAVRGRLARDFALIDNQILMLGRISAINQSVYHYDFFDLPAAARNPQLFERAFEVFSDRNQVIQQETTAKLFIAETGIRRAIHNHPKLQEPMFSAEKEAILYHVRRLGYQDD